MQGRDLELLEDAARAAGEIALRHFRAGIETVEKPGGLGPVTAADLEIDRMLRAELTAARPDYGWLSEESEDGAERLAAERVFIIDPIDGTRAFIDGQDHFAHSLAISRGDRIVAGVVYLPVLDLSYTAFADGPALLNGQRIAPSNVALRDATVLANRASVDPSHWRDERMPPFRREFLPSLAWRLCLAAEGRFDAALSLRAAWEWDIAAGSLIAERAGAAVTDRRGGTMSFNSPRAMVNGLIVGGAQVHGQLLAALAR